MKDFFNNKNNRIYKTKPKVLSQNTNNKNQNIYFTLNPEYQDNDYINTDKNFSRYNTNNPQGFTYIPLNVINNNISSNDRIYQKYYYINERNTPLNNYYSNNNQANITDELNFLNEKNELNSNFQNMKNLEEKNYMNKTNEYKFLNRTLSSYENTDINSRFSQLSFRQSSNSNNYANIYRNKLVKVFVQNINKIMRKIKKKEIMTIFFNNLKNYYNKKRTKINYLNLNQNDPKYHEYKDLIYNYIKSKNNIPISKIYNMLKPQDRIKFMTINNDTKNRQRDESTNKNAGIEVEKNEIERFKKLQKKYGNIYNSKKKEIISFENKIKNYMNQKTIEGTSSINIDDDISRKKFIYNKTPNINAYKTKNIFKRKRRINSQSSSKSYKTISEQRNIYNIYIVKNIITSDKSLYVNIKYINLDNYNSITSFYSNDMLGISYLTNINLIGNKNNVAKHNKKLSKIEEEMDDKINADLSISIKDNNKYKGKKEGKNIKSIKDNMNDNSNNNKVYKTKNFRLLNIRKKYINYKTLKGNEKEEN